MGGTTDSQDTFFDSYIREHFLPQDHELLRIQNEVDFSVIEEHTKDRYAPNLGRPSRLPPGDVQDSLPGMPLPPF
jgi:hypothetical protein